MSRYRAIYIDPDGERWGLPTWPWRMAPDGLFTRRQLKEFGLCPAHSPVGQIMWHGIGGDRFALLYDIKHARPRRKSSDAQLIALAKALAARMTCPLCKQYVGYVIPKTLNSCLECDEQRHEASALSSGTKARDGRRIRPVHSEATKAV